MKLAQLSVDRPVTTAMIFIAMVVLGLVSLSMLGLDLMPEMEIPAVSVITAYEGAGPEEVETLITEPMEDTLSTISGVDEVISVSKEGISAVTLKFAWGEKIDESTNDVREKIDLIRDRLPEEADNPVIFKFDLAMAPIAIIAITAGDSYPNLQNIVDDEIVDPLKRVEGVASVTPRGGLERQIRVDIDRDKLAALNLSVAQVNAALAAQNISTPGGNIKTGYKDYLLRTPEEFSSPQEVAEVIIAQRNGIPVKLKDVADVRDFFKERTYEVRMNSKRAMAVFVQKQSGENTVAVARAVREKLEEIKKNLPPDVEPKMVMDNSEFILASVGNLRNTVLWAVFFVFIVLLFFLRNLRASIIVALAIPTSLIFTFFLMYLAGYTINDTSLASLAIAVGLVVDNAIVVVDNISRHRAKGQRPKEGAILGANEVGVPVIASTLTTISIFAPIIFVGGITAIVFGQFAAIVTMALVVSLFTALMLVPMACSKILTVRDANSPKSILDSFYNLGEKTLNNIEELYVKFLKWSLYNRKIIFISCIVLFISSIGLVSFIGTEFFPEQDQNRLMANYELPIGTRYERTGAVARQLQKIVENSVPERRDSFIRWGVYGSASGGQFATEEESYKGILFISLKPKRQRDVSPSDIIERLRKITADMPGVTIRYSAEDPVEAMVFGSGGKLAVELYGHDMDLARKYADSVKAAIESIDGIKDVEISRKEEKPEIKVIVDREKASKLGLDVRTIGKTIETFFAGDTATKYREGGDEYDIEVRLQEQDRNRIEDLRDVFISLPTGAQVSLANIAKIEQGVGPTKIERKDQARYITVSGEIISGKDLGSAVKEVEKALDSIPAPPGFSYKFAGAEKERAEAFRLLLIAVGLGMVLVYMVMASQFESLRDPFIIFLSIPFGIVGVIIALALTGQRMSVISFLALIMMVGIVVNDGIVLVSFISILRRRGLSVYSAIIEGGRSRMRPVICTTATTILAMIPLALSRNEGSEIWVPFAITVIGGLVVGTVITLVMMPTLYSVFEGFKITDAKGQL
ncbi:MAG: efflux RND transporter permease subunit [Phycisphaerae bacterium]|nr:efflux RND transporter permease subunit [Phycisphaerae bacterium]MDD5381190.1 efflux RND transporter permease subunit [Phycisphaerae bacterium]